VSLSQCKRQSSTRANSRLRDSSARAAALLLRRLRSAGRTHRRHCPNRTIRDSTMLSRPCAAALSLRGRSSVGGNKPGLGNCPFRPKPAATPDARAGAEASLASPRGRGPPVRQSQVRIVSGLGRRRAHPSHWPGSMLRRYLVASAMSCPAAARGRMRDRPRRTRCARIARAGFQDCGAPDVGGEGKCRTVARLPVPLPLGGRRC
jgi:hypothetical protein